jgi:general stress protein 26
MTDLSDRGDLAKVAELIRKIRVALLTTLDTHGRLHSRPVQLLQLESDRTLWFFTDWHSPKVTELQNDERVGLGFADPASSTFVAVSGTGRLLRDPVKARELWTAEQRAFYPDGPQDSRLALLRVEIELAEYWLAPGRTSYLVAAAHAAVTGEPTEILGAHGKVD